MPKTILIAEDEEVLSNVLAKKFSRLGFRILVTRDGVETLEKLRADQPDLLLLDIIMPKLNGFEVLESMQADPKLKGIPVIVISNSGQPVEIERAQKLGAVDYLIKTQFDPDELTTKVLKQIGPMPQEKDSADEASDNAAQSIDSILIIEDDKFLRDLISQKLRKEGFNVSEAIDGEEGMRKVQEERPILVLLDLILPGMDGFELLKRMKENPATKAIPVIILSNLGQREDVERGMRLGAEDFLIKAHFTPGEIIEKIKSALPQ